MSIRNRVNDMNDEFLNNQAKKLFNQFSLFSILLLTFEVLFTVLIYRTVIFQLVDQNTSEKNLFYLTFSFYLFFILLQYESVQKNIVYTSWTLIAISHLVLFFIFDDQYKVYPLYQSFHFSLLLPLIQVVLYQIFRQISLKTYGYETGFPSRGLKFIYNQNRDITIIDKIAFMVLLLSYPIFLSCFH